MFTFLRKIRQSIIASGRTSQYLLYAIGEIALVVIGILIALQINNWNEWRKERIEEREILEEIKINMEKNIGFIQNTMRRQKYESESGEIILDAINQKKPWHDSLGPHLWNTMASHVPTVSATGYESLRNKGVDIILSDTLQDAIVECYENFNNIKTVLTRIVHTEIKPNSISYLFENFERRIDPDNDWRILVPNDYNALIRDPKFKNVIEYLQSHRVRSSGILLTRSIEEANQVIHLIDEELNRTD